MIEANEPKSIAAASEEREQLRTIERDLRIELQRMGSDPRNERRQRALGKLKHTQARIGFLKAWMYEHRHEAVASFANALPATEDLDPMMMVGRLRKHIKQLTGDDPSDQTRSLLDQSRTWMRRWAARDAKRVRAEE